MLIHLQSFIRTCMDTHLHISLYTAMRKKSRHELLSLRFLFLLFFLPFFFLFPWTSCFDLARSFAWQNIHIFMCHSQTCLHTVFASILFRRYFFLGCLRTHMIRKGWLVEGLHWFMPTYIQHQRVVRVTLYERSLSLVSSLFYFSNFANFSLIMFFSSILISILPLE